MNTITEKCIEAYGRHKHLGRAGREVGIPWQTVYCHLKRAGVPVVGDKSRYGSDADRLAALAESKFKGLVPYADDQNRKRFQSKIDFIVLGYRVDVKASTKKLSSKKGRSYRWSFSLKKQELIADFFVCFAFDGPDLAHCFLIPGEIAKNYKTMSISSATRGKWWEYEIDTENLSAFFMDLPDRRP